MVTLYETINFVKENYSVILLIIGGSSVAYYFHKSAQRYEKKSKIIRESGLEKRLRE